MYSPICKQQGLKIGTGTVIIVTGWTPVEKIAKHLQPHQYAAIGNLYSPAGVDYLIRNILANPQVTGVVALKLTKQDANAGSIDALDNFFKTGFPIEGIPQEDLDRVRSLYCFCFFQETPEKCDPQFSLNAALPVVLNELISKPALGGEPKHYYPKVTESKILPGTMWGHRIESKTIADAWVKILHRIRATGKESPSGYGKRQELIDLMAIVTDEPEDLHVPDWLSVDREFLSNYFPQILEDQSSQEKASGAKYTYGSRLRSHFCVDQIEQCITKLIHEPDAASAVMSLWDTQDHVWGSSPCLNHLWVRILDGALSLTAIFRSNDMFQAWCSNAFGLRKLQEHIVARLFQETGIRYGLAPLITLSQSAHIYDHSYAYADKVIAEKYGKSAKEYNDPVGNYEIKIECGEIIINRMLPWGNVCAEYRGGNPVQLAGKILADAPAMLPDHALYLGRELQRAWDCIKRGEDYWQE